MLMPWLVALKFFIRPPSWRRCLEKLLVARGYCGWGYCCWFVVVHGIPQQTFRLFWSFAFDSLLRFNGDRQTTFHRMCP
jgi:hypothetical protein